MEQIAEAIDSLAHEISFFTMIYAIYKFLYFFKPND